MNQLLNNCSAVLNNISRLFCNYSTDIFIQSGILIILLLIIDFLLRKRVRATFRYWIWMLVLIKLMLPPAFSLPTGIGRWFGDCLPAQTSLSKQASNIVLSKPAGASTPLDINRSAEIPQVHLSQDSPESVAPASFVISNSQALTWQAAVFIIWFIGAAALSVLLVHRILFVRRLIAQSEPAKNRYTDLLDQCRQRIGIKSKIELRLSGKLQSPAVCGFFRPIILIPTGLIEKLSPDKLRAVLIHELAHVKRGDLWVNCVQTFLQIIYFYNPLVWLANAIIRRIREQAVDEMVLVTLDAEAMSYSNTLIDIAEMTFLKTSLSLQLIGVVESKKALSRRIKHILNRPIPKNAKLGALSFVVIILSAIVLLPMAKADRKNSPVVRNDQANEQSVATLPNGVTFEQSKVSPIGNYALGFDGIKDFMEIHASESLKLGRDFTIQTWIKPEFPDTNTPDNGRNLLSKGGYINEHPDDKGNRMVHAYGFSLNLIPKENARVELDMSTANGGIYTSPIIFQYESDWLHLAIVSRKEGGGASRGIYYIQTGEVPYQPAPNSNIIVGGNSLTPMGKPFKGQIAELRIWNRALDPDEVEHYKTVALTGDEPNLVGCWTFEQGQGQRVHDLSRFRNDASLGSSYAVEDSDPVWVRIKAEKENEKLRGTQGEVEKTDVHVKEASSQTRIAVLPDVDSKNLMLDLASGELVEVPKADTPKDMSSAIDKLNKGDLIFDASSLILVRGAMSGSLPETTEPFKTYKIGQRLPEIFNLKTREGVEWTIEIHSIDKNGCRLRYYPVHPNNYVTAVPLTTLQLRFIKQLLEQVIKVEDKYPKQATHWPAGPQLYHVDAQGHVTIWCYQQLGHRSNDSAADEVGWGSSQQVDARGMYYLPDGTPLQSRWRWRNNVGGMTDIRVKLGRTVAEDEHVGLIYRHKLPSDNDLFSRDRLERKIMLHSWNSLPLAIIVRIDRPMRLSSWWVGDVKTDVQHFDEYDQLLMTDPPGDNDKPMLITIQSPLEVKHKNAASMTGI